MSVRMRQYVERQIVQAVIDDALLAGYRLAVDDGETRPKITTNKAQLMRALFDLDDAQLNVYLADRKQVGWVYFVFGNDGPDVINDHTTNLEGLLARAERLAEYWYGDGAWVEFKG